MQITIGKVLSLLVTIGYVGFVINNGAAHDLTLLLTLSLPLALIWFPEEIGNLTGYFKTGYVNVQTPGVIVSFIGWFFLVGLPVLLYFMLR